MKDIESKVRAALSSALDDVQGRSNIDDIRRRAGRQRNALIAGGLTATVAVAVLASSLLGERSSPTIVAEPPHGVSPTFGRYAIELGQGFDADGNPITATGIVEVDAKRNELCIDASVKGVTQVHLHQRETGDQVSLPDRPKGCFVSPPDVVDDILAHHEQWYIEIHTTDSGATIRSDLEPISNLPDPEAPCDLLEEGEMSAAARIEINGGGEVPSRPDPQGNTVALCRYFAAQPYTSLTIYIDDAVTEREFEEKLNRDPINTFEVDDIGDAAYIHAGVSLTILVDDVTTTATVQHFGTVEETRRMLRGLGNYIAQELREHQGLPDEAEFNGFAGGWSELALPPEVRSTAATAWSGQQLFVWGGYVYTGFGNESANEDGFIYDASSDSWTALPLAPLSARIGAVGTWTGSEFLVWGGRDDGGGGLSDGAAFDPATARWRVLPEAPISGRAPLSVWTGRELIVWGTSYRVDGPPRDGAAYDAATDVWREIARAPIALTDATAVWTGEEMIVFGAELHGGNEAVTPTAIGAAYDPATDSWRRLPDSDLSPQASTAAWNGRELIAWDYGHKTAAYDPLSDRWRSLPRVPLDASECSPKSVGLGSLVFGDYCGYTVGFDPKDDRWIPIPAARGTPGWGFELIGAGDAALLLGRNVETGEERLFAYGSSR